jgi:hypothetical protein
VTYFLADDTPIMLTADTRPLITAHLTAIISRLMSDGAMVPHVTEQRTMEDAIRDDGTVDPWNRVKVTKYVVSAVPIASLRGKAPIGGDS